MSHEMRRLTGTAVAALLMVRTLLSTDRQRTIVTLYKEITAYQAVPPSQLVSHVARYARCWSY